MTEHDRGIGALSAGAATAAIGGLALGWIQMRRRATVAERARAVVRQIDPKLAQGVAHVGSAVVLGSGFGSIAGALPTRPLRVAAGALFGAAFGGAVDGLTRQPERRWGMILAHALGGALLGAVIPAVKKPITEAAPSIADKAEHALENVILAGGTIIEAQEPAHA